jgi:hypothetical protein
VGRERAWRAFATPPQVLADGTGVDRRRAAGRFRRRHRDRDRRPVAARRAGSVACGGGAGGSGLDSSGADDRQLVPGGRLLPRWPVALPALGPRHPVGPAGPVLVFVPEPIGTAIRAPDFVPACVRVFVGIFVGVGVAVGVLVAEQFSIAIPVAEQVSVPVAVAFTFVCFVLAIVVTLVCFGFAVVSFLVPASDHVGSLLDVGELQRAGELVIGLAAWQAGRHSPAVAAAGVAMLDASAR